MTETTATWNPFTEVPPCLVQDGKRCLPECECGLAGGCAREIADSMALMADNEAKARIASREYRQQLRAREKANG